jgi:hypothetical protein
LTLSHLLFLHLHCQAAQPWAVHFKKVPQKLNEELNWFGTRIPSRIIIIQDDEVSLHCISTL